MNDQAFVGLKEWGAFVGALVQGRQILMLRAGGCVELRGRVQEEHREFIIYPRYDGQDASALKEVARSLITPMPTFNDDVVGIPIETFVVATASHPLRDWDQARALSPYHIWSDAEVRRRWEAARASRQQLHAVILRAFCLPDRTRIPEDQSYAEAGDWIRLVRPLRVAGSRPALPDGAFLDRLNEVKQILR